MLYFYQFLWHINFVFYHTMSTWPHYQLFIDSLRNYPGMNTEAAVQFPVPMSGFVNSSSCIRYVNFRSHSVIRLLIPSPQTLIKPLKVPTQPLWNWNSPSFCAACLVVGPGTMALAPGPKPSLIIQAHQCYMSGLTMMPQSPWTPPRFQTMWDNSG